MRHFEHSTLHKHHQKPSHQTANIFPVNEAGNRTSPRRMRYSSQNLDVDLAELEAEEEDELESNKEVQPLNLNEGRGRGGARARARARVRGGRTVGVGATRQAAAGAAKKATVAEEAAAAAELNPRPKKGKGSKSGVNARSTGASDDEISKLSEKSKESTKITIPKRRRWSDGDKRDLVSCVTDTRFWGKMKLNQSEVMQHVRASFLLILYK